MLARNHTRIKTNAFQDLSPKRGKPKHLEEAISLFLLSESERNSIKDFLQNEYFITVQNLMKKLKYCEEKARYVLKMIKTNKI